MFVEHKEVGEVTEAPAKALKPSQAMRAGIVLRPKSTGGFFSKGGSCALGAMWEGATGSTNVGKGALALYAKFPQLDLGRVRHPEHGSLMSLAHAIVSLNDGCGWTRERIADWLEAKGY